MKKVGAVMILFAAMVCSVQAQDSTGNRFENVTVGFEITKPVSWVFMTAEQNLENLKRVKFSDEKFHEEVIKYANTPLVAIAKYAEPYDDLNPGIKVNVRPFLSLKGTAPTEILKIMLPVLEKVMADYTLAQEPIEVEIAGIKSGYARVNYTTEIADGRTFPTTSELWVVPRGDYFFLIGAGTRPDESNGTREEIGKILETVKIRQE